MPPLIATTEQRLFSFGAFFVYSAHLFHLHFKRQKP